MSDKKIVAFFGCVPGPSNPTWYLSNFAFAPFWACVPEYDKEELGFMCVEMWMMFNKAVLFKDWRTAENILSYAESYSDNIDEARRDIHKISQDFKKMGRSVKGFNDTLWKQHRERIVKQGLTYKFKQNKDLGRLLKRTGDAQLAEASPYDKIWGTGLNKESTTQFYKDGRKWPGSNLLGKCLMEVRSDLKSSST